MIFQVFYCLIIINIILCPVTESAECLQSNCEPIDPDETRDAVAIIISRGFKAETHHVITDDGYIITSHRIVNPKYKRTVKPVLLQHGLLSSSDDWLIGTPFENNNTIIDDIKSNGIEGILRENAILGKNLPFTLAYMGFDVWLGNSRGNKYSTNHTKLNPKKDKEFWHFSFDEMSQYDLTANIRYILNITKRKSLSYIGHSQGTIIMFALLSTEPHYSKIINPFIALAPVAFVGNIISPIRYIAPFKEILKIEGGDFLPPNKLIEYLAYKLCDGELRFICSNILFLLGGIDKPQLNMTRLGVYLSHVPAGTSSWDVLHWLQMIESKRFCKFDYGKQQNQQKYGQSVPPDYPLFAINSTEIALMSGANDYLADPDDVSILKSNLKVPLLDDYLVPYKQWSHLDFIYGIDAGKYVYSRVIDILRKTL